MQLSSRSDTVGKSRTPSSINVTAAMFAHLCNFQITSSLGYTAERICLKSVGCVKLNLLLLRKISYFIFIHRYNFEVMSEQFILGSNLVSI